MKRLIPILIVFGVFLWSGEWGWSADFQKGLTAARSGDFVTALREWIPFAEQGHVGAQLNLGHPMIKEWAEDSPGIVRLRSE